MLSLKKLKIIISNIGEASIINKEYFLKFYEHITKYNLIEENFLNQWLPKGLEPIKLHDYQVELISQAIKHNDIAQTN